MRVLRTIIGLGLVAVSVGACSSSAKESSLPGAGGTISLPGGPSKTSGSAASAPVDVCALLTEEDAVAVATKQGLVNGPATYSLTKEKQEYPSTTFEPPLGGCKFLFYSATDATPRSISGAVVIEAIPAAKFDAYRGQGSPVPGVGDEAVTITGDSVARVGNIMLRAGEDSFTNEFVLEIYRRMADHLK